MICHLNVMLYVVNVEETALFWKDNLGFRLSEVVDFDSSKSIVLDTGEGFSLQLFDKGFIKRASPDVSLETPSLMFTVADMKGIHQKLISTGTFVGEILSKGANQVFNFADNEGRYFVISSR